MATNSQSDSQHIGSCAILMNPQGQVLLGKRKNSYKSGFYGLPGGRIELDEPVLVSMKREVLEETGLQIENLEFCGVVRDFQIEYDFIHFVHVATNVTGTPQLTEPEKCEGWEWFDRSALHNVLPGHLAAIHLYFNGAKLIDLTTQTQREANV